MSCVSDIIHGTKCLHQTLFTLEFLLSALKIACSREGLLLQFKSRMIRYEEQDPAEFN